MRLEEYSAALEAVRRVISYCSSHMPDFKALLTKSIRRFHVICERKKQPLVRQPANFVVRVTRDLMAGKVRIISQNCVDDHRLMIMERKFLGVLRMKRICSSPYRVTFDNSISCSTGKNFS